jgi:hypothetical protein
MGTAQFIVEDGSGDAQRLDLLTAELAGDLRQIRGVTVEPITKPGTHQTKTGTALEIGQLLVSGGALGSVAWAVRDIAIHFLERTRAQSITVRNGDRKVVIVRPADDQVDEIVGRLHDLLGDD